MRWLLLVCACDLASTGPIGAAPPPDGAAPSDAVPGCATAPLGDWHGAVTMHSEGDSSRFDLAADVTFTLASRDGCVDTFTPSGAITFTFEGALGCQPQWTPGTIVPSSGELVIDRSTSPATYTLNGYSTWDATDSCTGETGTIGGRWAAETGFFEGDVIDGAGQAGARPSGTGAPFERFAWHLRPSATRAAPSVCVEPATEAWTFVGVYTRAASAQLSWRRVSTAGCVDHFAPSGTVTALVGSGCTVTPPSQPVGADDGTMIVDRGVDPPTFTIVGDTHWSAECGGITGSFGGEWANEAGAYRGDAVGGAVETDYGRVSWRLSR